MAKLLFLNQAYAAGLSCVKYVIFLSIECHVCRNKLISFILRCNGVPKVCMTDDDGDILCNKCAADTENASANKGAENIPN